MIELDPRALICILAIHCKAYDLVLRINDAVIRVKRIGNEAVVTGLSNVRMDRRVYRLNK